MSNHQIFIVSTFANEIHKGNPCGVILLENDYSDSELKKIVSECRVPEVSFIRKRKEKGCYDIRFMMADYELEICGNGTIGAAHIVFESIEPNLDEVKFFQSNQEILCKKTDFGYSLNMPLLAVEPYKDASFVEKALGCKVTSLYSGRSFLAWVNSEVDLISIRPQKRLMLDLPLPGVIVAAHSNKYDYVCRYFAPQKGVDEDIVTGTANTTIATFLNKKNGITHFIGSQMSERGGEVKTTIKEGFAVVEGNAITFIRGEMVWKIS